MFVLWKYNVIWKKRKANVPDALVFDILSDFEDSRASIMNSKVYFDYLGDITTVVKRFAGHLQTNKVLSNTLWGLVWRSRSLGCLTCVWSDWCSQGKKYPLKKKEENNNGCTQKKEMTKERKKLQEKTMMHTLRNKILCRKKKHTSETKQWLTYKYENKNKSSEKKKRLIYTK